jgi:DNA gyrase inhibitor GyrI
VDGSGVSLVKLPPRRVAAIRFDGRTTDERVAEREAELRAWMATRGLEAASPPLYAYYNDPLTPGFLRRNEVMIEVAGGPSQADG